MQPRLQVSVSNSIHPSAIIAGDVRIGSGNTIGPFVVITGPATIGDNNWIGAGVVIGAPPEVRSFTHPEVFGESKGEGAGVAIGDRNVIREYVQVHQGWHKTTTIENDAFIMNQTYVAHDCVIGSHVTLASSVLLAGHVAVAEGANLGLGTSVHQRVRIGALSMIGMGSVVVRDVPPFAKAYGNPARVAGANAVGMQRRGISEHVIAAAVGEYSGSSGGHNLASLSAYPEIAALFDGWVGEDAASAGAGASS